MVRVETIKESIRVEIDRSPRLSADEDAIDAAWRELCAHNPRYFNAPILAFDSYDAITGVVHASIEQYKHHAVRDEIDVGLSLLAVTGILVARDECGHKRVLLGKRSPSTHRCGNLWEFGPSGGIDVPEAPTNTLDLDAIVREIGRETIEECGITIADCAATPIAVVHDDAVGSTDLAIMIDLGEIPPIEHGWEYLECRWVDADTLNGWTPIR